MTPRVMITGASGLLGRAFARAFNDLDPITCAWRRASGSDLKLDLTNAAAVEAAVAEHRPGLILHSAAERKPDACENQRDQTRALNVAATETLAQAAAKAGARMLYISTDYVFDGATPPYSVDAERNPLNYYGQSKMEGEDATLAASDRHLVLRVPILYGAVESLDESPVSILLEEVRDPRPRGVDHWAARYPTYVDDVAQTVRQWSANLQQSAGIYHFRGAEMITKYEMAVAIAELFDLPHAHLSPVDHPPAGAPRPRDCQLDISKLEAETTLRQTPFRTAIKQALHPFIQATEDTP